ncbi:VOC family protein [Leifsonia poae]|uniref:VOC family protein n=1 Tax=Leifsonia poae TaxID=110933 RepID=UPI001CBDFD66|nr:VOC family protein [Leifsonia poae]
MATLLNPYLNFRARTREVMTFYQTVFGGTLDISTFADLGMNDDPAIADNVMHSVLTTDTGFTIMAADVPDHMELAAGSSISLSLSGDDEPRLSGYFHALMEDGTVVEPLSKAPWGDSFGMGLDRFGVSWLVNISGAQPA